MGDDRIHVDDREVLAQIKSQQDWDLRPFWPMVVPLFHSWMSRQFATAGAFGGRPWAPLSPGYAARKQAMGGDRRLLVFSGGMLQAATRTKRTALPRSLTLAIPDDEWGHGPKGVRRPVLQYHQDGIPGRLPARPLVFESQLPPQAAAELQDAADRFVGDIVRKWTEPGIFGGTRR